MRTTLATFLALCLATASAMAATTYRFATGLIAIGDSTGLLIQRAGQPDRVVQLENRFGAGVGERWEYYFRDKQVSFTISGGRVTRIDQVP